MNFCYKIELPVGLADLLCGRDVRVMRDASGKDVSKETGALLSDNGWQSTYIVAWGDGSAASDQLARQQVSDLLHYAFERCQLSLEWQLARTPKGEICHVERYLKNAKGEVIGGDNWLFGVRIIKEEYDLATKFRVGWSFIEGIEVISEKRPGLVKAEIKFLPVVNSEPDIELYKLLQYHSFAPERDKRSESLLTKSVSATEGVEERKGDDEAACAAEGSSDDMTYAKSGMHRGADDLSSVLPAAPHDAALMAEILGISPDLADQLLGGHTSVFAGE